MNILDFKKMKNSDKKITIITCYDYWSAKIISQTDVDCILVGDSLAMIMHGYKNTINANIDMMCAHTKAVARGAGDKFIIADLPFASYRKSRELTVDVSSKLMQAGACAVKLENNYDALEDIQYLINSGIPVMGHIGLTPQFVHNLGGFKAQGKEKNNADILLDSAKKLEIAGCFSIVLECIKSDVASEITKSLNIPTIGIGSGINVNGQVMVFHDLLGMQKEITPKFVKKYMSGCELMTDAITKFNEDVKKRVYPDENFSY